MSLNLRHLPHSTCLQTDWMSVSNCRFFSSNSPRFSRGLWYWWPGFTRVCKLWRIINSCCAHFSEFNNFLQSSETKSQSASAVSRSRRFTPATISIFVFDREIVWCGFLNVDEVLSTSFPHGSDWLCEWIVRWISSDRMSEEFDWRDRSSKKVSADYFSFPAGLTFIGVVVDICDDKFFGKIEMNEWRGSTSTHHRHGSILWSNSSKRWRERKVDKSLFKILFEI